MVVFVNQSLAPWLNIFIELVKEHYRNHYRMEQVFDFTMKYTGYLFYLCKEQKTNKEKMNVISFRMLCAPCNAVVILIEIIIAHLLGQTLLFSLSRPSSVPIKFSIKSNLLFARGYFDWILLIFMNNRFTQTKTTTKQKDTMNSSHLSPPEALTSNL